MSSMVYQRMAHDANTNIDRAKISINDSITCINRLISQIPNNNGYDALGRNSDESLGQIKNSLNKSFESMDGIKSSIMNTAILEDQKLDMLKKREEQNKNIEES